MPNQQFESGLQRANRLYREAQNLEKEIEAKVYQARQSNAKNIETQNLEEDWADAIEQSKYRDEMLIHHEKDLGM